MITIAITGGIGSGKSTVTDIILENGFRVIDADEMAREITGPHGKAIPYIREHFGDTFILPDGSMDRAKMRDLIFQNPEAKRVLEEGTTEIVKADIDAIRRETKTSDSKALFFDIPQLVEQGRQEDFDQVWVVTADINIRKARIMARDNVPKTLIDLIISSQAEEFELLEIADYIIYNNGTVQELRSKIQERLAKL